MGSKLYKQFENAVVPYLENWDEWIASDYCFISEKEAELICLFMRSGTISATAKKARNSIPIMSSKLRSIKLKLISGIHIYQDWSMTKKVDPEYPMNIPVVCLKVDIQLKRVLFSMGDTLKEILSNHSIEKMRSFRGVGETKLNNLKLHLTQYNCQHYLKSDADFLVEEIVKTTPFVNQDKAIKEVEYLKQITSSVVLSPKRIRAIKREKMLSGKISVAQIQRRKNNLQDKIHVGK